MRYELTDHEWTAIRPMLPNKPRGLPRVNDRRVLNGIFWVLRPGAPWRVAMVAVIVALDFVFFRNRFWERLMANIGIVLVFAAFYFRFLKPS